MFFPWPEDGLVAVADKFLSDLGLDTLTKAVVEQCILSGLCSFAE